MIDFKWENPGTAQPFLAANGKTHSRVEIDAFVIMEQRIKDS